MIKRIYSFVTGSIRNQLMLGIALVHAVMMSVFIIDLVERQRDFLSQQGQKQTLALAKTLAANSTSWVLARDIVGLDEVLHSNSAYPDLEYAMVMTPFMEILGHSDKSKRGLYPVDQTSQQLITAAPEAQVLLSNTQLIDVAYPILIDEELIGWARVGINQQLITDGLYRITLDGLLYTLAAILIGSFFAYWMARGLTRGLASVVAVADGTRAGKRELRARLQRDDEIGHLADGLDLMLDTLQQNEQALTESKNQLRQVTDILPAPVARVDKEGRYLFASAAFEPWFGKPVNTILGKTQKECLPDNFYRQAEPYFQQALSGHHVAFETSLLTADEKPLHGLMHALPDIDEHGEVQGCFMIMTDLTERKQIEQEAQLLREQLSQATKMEAMGHLTAGIAHDFNNILGAMLGYTELAKDQLREKGITENTDRYLQQVLDASGRAKELIDQLLLFSRQKSATGDELPITLLEPVCKEVVTLLRSSIASSIELSYQVENKELKARIQPINLHQMILNLGINARDAIGDYGSISITLKQCYISHQTCNACHHAFSGDFIEITVSDSGSGIESELRDKIFDPFFTTKEVGKGTGMGLAVVHGLVHSVGGHLLVESSPGTGSSIRILLPADNSLPEDEPALPQKQLLGDKPLAGLQIMLIDDETMITDMLTEFLSIQGADIKPFNSPEAAAEYFMENAQVVDLVITDETMPGLLGTHLAEQMLKIKPSLPIILCTGYSKQKDSDIYKEIGIAGYFRKPVKTKDLLVHILQLLKKLN